jgi:hypothetical protein
VPFGNQFTDYSIKKSDKAELIYLNTNPYLEIGKKYQDNKIEVFLAYAPNFIFMLPEDSSIHNVENKDNMIYPPPFFVEHKLGFRLGMDFVTLMEDGLVRKGFKMKSHIDWIKKTPDFEWGYKDNLDQPVNKSVLFYLYLEYSNYIDDLFYFSLGLHYKGGINLYKNHLILINKGVIGFPFDSMMKIHGLNDNQFTAEHVFLFNSLYGVKMSNKFHLGAYIDACTFFERNADTYLHYFNNSGFYNNILFGYGCFFKWNPAKLLVAVIEVSFCHELGQNTVHGPVIGCHIQKAFINPKRKAKR